MDTVIAICVRIILAVGRFAGQLLGEDVPR